MNEEQWGELFTSLGIRYRFPNDSFVLRTPNSFSLQMYWCRNPRVGFYFSGNMQDYYPSQLWQRVDPALVKDSDRNRHNVIPLPGREEEALRVRLESPRFL